MRYAYFNDASGKLIREWVVDPMDLAVAAKLEVMEWPGYVGVMRGVKPEDRRAWYGAGEEDLKEMWANMRPPEGILATAEAVAARIERLVKVPTAQPRWGLSDEGSSLRVDNFLAGDYESSWRRRKKNSSNYKAARGVVTVMVKSNANAGTGAGALIRTAATAIATATALEKNGYRTRVVAYEPVRGLYHDRDRDREEEGGCRDDVFLYDLKNPDERMNADLLGCLTHPSRFRLGSFAIWKGAAFEELKRTHDNSGRFVVDGRLGSSCAMSTDELAGLPHVSRMDGMLFVVDTLYTDEDADAFIESVNDKFSVTGGRRAV